MSPSPLVFGATVPSHPSPSCRGRGNARGRAVGHGGHHVLGGHPGTGPRKDGETELQCFARRRDVSGAKGLLASWAVRLASVVGAQWIAIPFFGGVKTRKGRKT